MALDKSSVISNMTHITTKTAHLLESSSSGSLSSDLSLRKKVTGATNQNILKSMITHLRMISIHPYHHRIQKGTQDRKE